MGRLLTGPSYLVAMFISGHPGAETLPWVHDEDGDSEFTEAGWNVTLRPFPEGGLDVRVYQDNCRRDKEVVYGLPFEHQPFVEALAGVLEARSKDPRLAELPEDLSAVAMEFLDLHGAWETEFEARDIGGQLYLQWRSPRPRLYARFNAWPGGKRVQHVHPIWELTTTENDRYSMQWRMPDTPLRRSTDFAEFVQLFKRTNEGGQDEYER